MIIKYKYFLVLALCIVLGQLLRAQSYCLTYAVTGNGRTVDVTVNLAAMAHTFMLGVGNLQIKYNTSALSKPILISNTLTSTGYYNGLSVTEPTPLYFAGTGDALVSLNFNFTGSAGAGLPISFSNTPIGVIRFDVNNGSVSPNFRPYDNGTAGTIVYNDDQNSPLFLKMASGCPVFDAVLPLEWLSMTAYETPYSTPKSATIDWSTAWEKSTSHFVVERSGNGQTFEAIGQVKGENKAAQYSFIDNKPLDVLNYYRIRQIDMDGKESVSKIASVAFKKSTTFKIYPTLFTTTNSFLNIEWTIDKGAGLPDFQIVTLLGQQVRMGKLTTRIDVSDLPQGAYIFKVGLEQAKFVKQ